MAGKKPDEPVDADLARLRARASRVTAPPSFGITLAQWAARLDARASLPIISCPTLVIQPARHPFLRSVYGEYLAEHIPGVRFVTRAGAGDFRLSKPDADEVADLVYEFVTGAPPAVHDERSLATVLFTDIVGSTELASKMGDKAWVGLLAQHDALVERELRRFRGSKVNPTGDGMVATFDGPARAVHCAQAIVAGVRDLGLEVRAGLHTGEIERRDDDVAGIAVHLAARISSLAGPGEILVSRTVTDLALGSGIEFDERGEHELKGLRGKWSVFAVVASS